MARKRKRQGGEDQPTAPNAKRAKEEREHSKKSHQKRDNSAEHPVLSLYYPNLQTLRTFILSSLPKHSKIRRKKIVALQHVPEQLNVDLSCSTLSVDPSHTRARLEDKQKLVALLDTTLVGVLRDTRNQRTAREADLSRFSQQLSRSRSSSSPTDVSQGEIIDYCVHILFNQEYARYAHPPHVLCNGYERSGLQGYGINESGERLHSIPGVHCRSRNSHVEAMKSRLWEQLLRLLGKDGDKIMLELILDCGIFVSVANGKDNFYQLSGIPLSELPQRKPNHLESKSEVSITTSPTASLNINGVQKPKKQSTVRGPSSITFVRNRMMYARAALTGKGNVHLGLRHIHALNRYPDHAKKEHTVHLMKYIFPRQFGLHNPFSSTVDRKETIQPFKDYTLREHEIAESEKRQQQLHPARVCTEKKKVPKRLRGQAVGLVAKMQVLHARCSYFELLKHYCPVEHIEGYGWTKVANARLRLRNRRSGNKSQLEESLLPNTEMDEIATTAGQSSKSLIDAATPAQHVSAFCRAVLLNILPKRFFGEDDDCIRNLEVLLHHVDTFVRLRRFEGLTLHTVMQKLRIGSMQWLRPPEVREGSKMSSSDTAKRKEILSELIYYTFDSIIIPLIRSNFHVTESNQHRNRVFYFRLDVWKVLTEPSLNTIKTSMLEEMNTQRAKENLARRKLGFSQIRLLPKGAGVRPIMNLKRRATQLQNGKTVLGESINKVMGPVFKALSYEKTQQADKLGSSLFSVGDLYTRLKAFRTGFAAQIQSAQVTFYFAKVDVQSCFDTIPQRRVVRLIQNLVSQHRYLSASHAEVKPPESRSYPPPLGYLQKTTTKFITRAKGENDTSPFEDVVEKDLANKKQATIFIEKGGQKSYNAAGLLELLDQHVERNIVKIGKKFFKQKQGIPQGSVLSSLLCNFFYADFEAKHLSFLQSGSEGGDGKGESLLLRLIDDFLLITTNKGHARRFLKVMHNGNEEYGITVNPAKSLANFDVSIKRVKIKKVARHEEFTYCGTVIDMRTLELTKDRERRKGVAITDSLTVESSKLPGRAFHRKAMASLKIQTHAMFTDTAFNSSNTVLSTLYLNFLEVGMKMYRSAKSMTPRQRPSVDMMNRTIRDLVNLAFILMQSKHKKVASTVHSTSKLELSPGPYRCTVTKAQVEWLASHALSSIFARKQSNYQEVLQVLNGIGRAASASVAEKSGTGRGIERLEKIAKRGGAVFEGYKY
ncbi:hypothetical protein MMC25_003861 [Agyrium rufum]|nr:hypothetical protein [Agyrium rufum]